MYYRVATRLDSALHWHWESRVIATLNVLLRVLRLYRTMPCHHICVFFSSSVEGLDLMLDRANKGLASSTLTIDQFLDDRWSIQHLEMTGLQTELSACESEGIGVAPAAREPSQQEKRMSTPLEGSVDYLEIRQLTLELGTPGDHDTSYKFTLPTSVTRTVPPCFLSIILAFSQVQLREPSYSCVQYVKMEALATASQKKRETKRRNFPYSGSNSSRLTLIVQYSLIAKDPDEVQGEKLHACRCVLLCA